VAFSVSVKIIYIYLWKHVSLKVYLRGQSGRQNPSPWWKSSRCNPPGEDLWYRVDTEISLRRKVSHF